MFEKVNPSHPDKVADRIAGALVDLAYSREENPKVAVEVLIGHGYAYVIAESSVVFRHEDVEPIVNGIVGKPLTVRLLSIPQDAHLAQNQADGFRCGDRSANVVRRLLPKGRKKGAAIKQWFFDKRSGKAERKSNKQRKLFIN